MTNYNDGNWHGWNGGECPVHPKSEIQALGINMKQVCRASSLSWRDFRGAFRVTKAHREPREFWIITEGEDYIYPSPAAAECDRQPGEEIIHVREVLE